MTRNQQYPTLTLDPLPQHDGAAREALLEIARAFARRQARADHLNETEAHAYAAPDSDLRQVLLRTAE